MARSFALRCTTWLVGRTPLRVSYAIAWLVGQAVFLLWPGGRRRCLAHMRRLSGGDRALARRYARRSFASYALYLVAFPRMGRPAAPEVRRPVPCARGSRSGVDSRAAGRRLGAAVPV